MRCEGAGKWGYSRVGRNARVRFTGTEAVSTRASGTSTTPLRICSVSYSHRKISTYVGGPHFIFHYIHRNGCPRRWICWFLCLVSSDHVLEFLMTCGQFLWVLNVLRFRVRFALSFDFFLGILSTSYERGCFSVFFFNMNCSINKHLKLCSRKLKR